MAQIITFYSYKGGTGRSMAMANVAWILASQRKKVLTIDWDLEAPGLHRYFAPFLIDPNLSASPGIIDFLRNFAVQSAKTAGDKDRPADWYRAHSDITDFALSLRWPHFRPGTLDLVPAGQQDADYATRVNSFNFDHFYTGLGGGAFLEAAKEAMQVYDYVLIDSRTGVSDTSGICTVQMPETVVVCFTLSNQSIDGAAHVAESIARQRTDRDGRLRVRILPMPMRTDPFEKDKLARRTAYAKQRFARFLEPLGEEYWKTVEVQYVPYYVYEEVLATFGDRRNESRTSILGAYEGITSVITRGEVREMIAPPEDERVRVLAKFEEISGVNTPSAAAPAPAPASAYAQDLYFSYAAPDEAATYPVLKQLADRSLAVASGLRLVTDPAWPERVTALLKQSRAFACAQGRFGLTSWQWRELALAVAHQRSERAQNREFPLLSFALSPQANGSSPPWMEPNQFDFSGRVENSTYDGFVQRLLGQIPTFPPSQNPFKGFDAYEEADAPLFFGRDRDIENLTGYLIENRIAFLRGSSGCGKSSLVNAGLKPHLRRQGKPAWEVVTMVPGRNPFFELSAALAPLLSMEGTDSTRVVETTRLTQSFREGGVDLIRQLRNLIVERPPRVDHFLIVVDQAERLFGVSDEKERESFLHFAKEASHEFSIHVLFVLAPECESKFAALRPEWADHIRHGYLLRGLDSQQIVDMHTGIQALTGRAHPHLTPEALAEWAKDPARLPLLSQWLAAGWDQSEVPDPATFAAAWTQRFLRGAATKAGGERMADLLRFVAAEDGRFRERTLPWNDLDEEAHTRIQPLKGARLLVAEPAEDPAGPTTVRLLYPSAVLFAEEMQESLLLSLAAIKWRTSVATRAAAWRAQGQPVFEQTSDVEERLAHLHSVPLTISEQLFVTASSLTTKVPPVVPFTPVSSQYISHEPVREVEDLRQDQGPQGDFTQMLGSIRVSQQAGLDQSRAELELWKQDQLEQQQRVELNQRRRSLYWAIGIAASLVVAALLWRALLPVKQARPVELTRAQLLEGRRYADVIQQHCQTDSDKVPLADCAYAYRSTGDYDRAIALYRRALQQTPDSARHYSDLAYAYALKTDHKQAIENSENAVKRAPADASLRVELGNYYLADGQRSRALEVFESALKIDPLLVSAQRGRRDALEGTKPVQAAVQPAGPITVYLHIANEAQRPTAFRLQAALQDLGYNVQGPQIVGDNAPARNEVRYSAKDDEIRAGRLTEDLSKSGFAFGAPKFLKWVKIAQPNRLEVWFAKAAETAGKDRIQMAQ